jgi:hypothetical protein
MNGNQAVRELLMDLTVLQHLEVVLMARLCCPEGERHSLQNQLLVTSPDISRAHQGLFLPG